MSVKNKVRFTASRIAFVAMFTALAFAVSFLHFPIFPAVPFLELDFANVFFMIEGFIFGPVETLVSIAAKELLCLLKTSSGGVGELANFIMSAAYIIVPSVAYRFAKGRWVVLLFLLIGCEVQVGSSFLVNRYITFPFYGIAEMFMEVWPFVIYFNIIKSVAISVIVFFVYKPLSRFIKSVSAKFSG